MRYMNVIKFILAFSIILINIDLNFSFESVIFGAYVCNTLPDKIITIDLTESELDSYNKFYIYKFLMNSKFEK